jgi:hypothetical protein
MVASARKRRKTRGRNGMGKMKNPIKITIRNMINIACRLRLFQRKAPPLAGIRSGLPDPQKDTPVLPKARQCDRNHCKFAEQRAKFY